MSIIERADTEFIEQAQAYVRSARVRGDALREVFALHSPNSIGDHVTCNECRDTRGSQVAWPCRTYRAMTEALNSAN